MNNFTFLGEELDTTKEYEFFSKDEPKGEFGFTATIKFKEDATAWAGTTRVCNNLTEVHSRHRDGKDIAFESDIHGTGCNLPIENIESVTVEIAFKLEEEY